MKPQVQVPVPQSSLTLEEDRRDESETVVIMNEYVERCSIADFEDKKK
jgi:hypothetical protein